MAGLNVEAQASVRTMPSLTELLLDKASPAVLKGKNPIRLTT